MLSETLSAIEALPPSQRALIKLICIDGYSYCEAAAYFGISVGTVMSRLFAARTKLKAQFSDLESVLD